MAYPSQGRPFLLSQLEVVIGFFLTTVFHVNDPYQQAPSLEI
jgi:hypothetical protein